MSLNHILSTATSGLGASQAALRPISNNIANVNTPGYARERVELEALVAGGAGNGVRVSGVERIVNRFLEAAAYAAHGDVGRYRVQQSYLDRLISEFGAPGSETGLAGRIEALPGLGPECTRFLRYHGRNDDSHMNKLYGLLDRTCTTAAAADDILLTAAVVGRLYALQLEEIDVE